MVHATPSGDFCAPKMKRSIPVLDLPSEENLDDEYLESLREVCQEWGCFRIVNHAISHDLIRGADAVCREMFQLPTETKMRNVSAIPHGGYLGPAPQVPFYESLGIVGAPRHEPIQSFSRLLWPQGNQKFCETIQEYTCKLAELLNRIHRLILGSWGVREYYASDFSHGKFIFRMNMYDVKSELASESLGLVAHTDGTSLTVLQEDETGGLQVMDKAGNWVDVEAIPNSFVVFAGDAFQAWSNGRIRNVKHRVMVKGGQSRLSLALFSVFPNEMEIRAPIELVDEEHPQRYRTFRFWDLVEYRMRTGRTSGEPLESFAGISSH